MTKTLLPEQILASLYLVASSHLDIVDMGYVEVAILDLLLTKVVNRTAEVICYKRSVVDPPQQVFHGQRYKFVLRDQSGLALEFYVDRKDQVLTFARGFDAVLRAGQVVRFECESMGIHGWIHGKAPRL
jgi:hypothetical protein